MPDHADETVATGLCVRQSNVPSCWRLTVQQLSVQDPSVSTPSGEDGVIRGKPTITSAVETAVVLNLRVVKGGTELLGLAPEVVDRALLVG